VDLRRILSHSHARHWRQTWSTKESGSATRAAAIDSKRLMKSIGEEWSRLTELYTQMSQEELQALAEEAYELTDMARDALRGEISRRGLHNPLLDQPRTHENTAEIKRAGDFAPSELDLVGAGQAFSLKDARWLKSVLDTAGIPAYFGSDNLEDVEKLNAAFDQDREKAFERGFQVGIMCRVPRAYQQLASQAIGKARQETEVEASPDDEADFLASCPRCHSPEIVFEGLETVEGADPDLDSKYNWSCDACGHEWKDDGIEERGKAAS